MSVESLWNSLYQRMKEAESLYLDRVRNILDEQEDERLGSVSRHNHRAEVTIKVLKKDIEILMCLVVNCHLCIICLCVCFCFCIVLSPREILSEITCIMNLICMKFGI